MLDALSEPLLVEVLRRLPVEDLEEARLACRAVDAAARCQLNVLTHLVLTRENTKLGGPDWARWPWLAKITIRYPCYAGGPHCWKVSERSELLRFFAPPADAARAVLHRVTALDLQRTNFSALAPAVALLRALPGLVALRIPWNISDFSFDALLQKAQELLPRLQVLDAGDYILTPSGAAAIGGMRQLRALYVDNVPEEYDEEYDEEENAAALAALPLGQLTSISFGSCPADALCDSARPWPQLRELRGVELRSGDVAALAAGAPRLQVLRCTVLDDEWDDEWEPAPAAGFLFVTHARMFICSKSFERVRLSALLPSVQHLCLDADYEIAPDLNLSGLTALTCLQIDCPIQMFPCIGMPTLPALSHLCLWIKEDALARLPQLPSTVVALDVTVHMPFAAEPKTVFVDDMLLAMAPLTHLTALHLSFDLSKTALASQATLARFAAALPALHTLVLRAPRLRVQEVSVLCAHPSLRLLAVKLANGEDRSAFEQLAAQALAVHGLSVQADPVRVCPIVNNDWFEYAFP